MFFKNSIPPKKYKKKKILALIKRVKKAERKMKTR